MPGDAVIAAQRHRGYIRFREARENAFEVFRADEAGRERHVGKDDVIPHRDIVTRLAEGKAHAAFCAEYVDNIFQQARNVAIVNRIDEEHFVFCCMVHAKFRMMGSCRKFSDKPRKVNHPQRIS